jgi:hypothetical protein
LNGEKTSISKTISVLILRVVIVGGGRERLVVTPPLAPHQHPEDKDRDGLQNVFFTIQPLDPADSPRELYCFFL